MENNTLRKDSRGQSELHELENQSKNLNDRINKIEHYFSALCSEFGSYTNRIAKTRNNGDEIVQILLNYAVNEKCNTTSADCIKEFADVLGITEDYKHAMVDRLASKVLQPLSSFNEDIKNVRTIIKKEGVSRKKETDLRKKLEKAKNEQSMRSVESQLNDAMDKANETTEELEVKICQFEAKKISSFKQALMDFVYIEMLWHAKALENFSVCYKILQNIDEKSDLTEFRNNLLGGIDQRNLNRRVSSTMELSPTVGRHKNSILKGSTVSFSKEDSINEEEESEEESSDDNEELTSDQIQDSDNLETVDLKSSSNVPLKSNLKK